MPQMLPEKNIQPTAPEVEKYFDAKAAREFVAESNLIEGIIRRPHQSEVHAHLAFMKLEKITIHTLQSFVSILQPGAILRDRAGLNATVGNHMPPAGGMNVVYALENMLDALNESPRDITPHSLHCAYESLHPFTDGNGRSGRALWAWHCLKRNDKNFLHRKFLHEFYYQTLQQTRKFGES